MRFEWDKNKRLLNLKRHGFDFVGIEVVFEGETRTIIDERFDYEEIRYVTFGFLEGRIVSVVHTYPEEDVIRIISVRKATQNEQKKFIEKISN